MDTNFTLTASDLRNGTVVVESRRIGRTTTCANQYFTISDVRVDRFVTYTLDTGEVRQVGKTLEIAVAFDPAEIAATETWMIANRW